MMAALRTIVLIVVATIAALPHAAIATMFTVGAPNGGWDMTTDLETWSSNLNFTVGDILVFRYAWDHDVAEVVKTEYDACTATKPIQSFTGGHTIVLLPVAGKRYFICSVSGHCAAGMKLEVDVVASGPAPGRTLPPQSPNLTSPAPWLLRHRCMTPLLLRGWRLRNPLHLPRLPWLHRHRHRVLL